MICVNCTGETTGPKITERGGPGPCERENREQRIYWSDTRRPSRSPTTVFMTEQVVLFRGATAVCGGDKHHQSVSSVSDQEILA